MTVTRPEGDDAVADRDPGAPADASEDASEDASALFEGTTEAEAAPTPTSSTTSGSSNLQYGYLPGLDGMRGLGVILMMLYHAEVTWVGDGAVFTVEMFFCLSGFLITSLFIGEHDRSGRLDLKRFWTRRGRRLLPATYLIFIPIAIYEVFLASSLEAQRIRGDGISVLLYGSNWWFIFSQQSYFEQFTATSPFSHTWSLAIEEQFYILVAVALFFGLRRWGPHRRIWPILAFGGALLSAVWMAFLKRMGDLTAEGLWPMGIEPASLPSWLQTFLGMNATGDPSRVYFGTDTRLQGLLIGVGMAFVLSRRDLSKLSSRTVTVLSALGIGGVLVMWLAVQGRNVHWIYYGGFLLFDLLMVLVLVVLAAPRRSWPVRAVSWAPIAYIGVLSYSLYVWHLPMFLIIDHSPVAEWVRGWPLTIVKLAVVFAIAYASYRFVENPIRREGLVTRPRRLTAVAAVATLVVVFLLASSVGIARGDRGADLAAGEVGSRTQTEVREGVPAEAPAVFLTGDSMPFSLGMNLRLDDADLDSGLSVEVAAQLGCGIGDAGSIINGRRIRRSDKCEIWESFWTDSLNQIQPSAVVVLAWAWELQDRWIENADGTVTELRVGTPEWERWFQGQVQRAVDVLRPFNVPIILLTLPCIDLEADTKTHPSAESAQPHRVPAVNAVLRKVTDANRNQGVVLIDLNEYLCPDGQRYRAVIDGTRMTDDGQHWSKDGADKLWNEWLGPRVAQVLENPPPGTG